MSQSTSAPSYCSEIITIGDEVLRGDVINGNAAYLGRALTGSNLPPRWCTTIADDRGEIRSALRLACERSRVIVLTGGLGPTPDDLTKEVVADFFQLTLVEEPELLDHVQALFRSRGAEMPETSRNQAVFPKGAKVIPNPHGTAAGIHFERNGIHCFVLPGVNVEMRQMTDEYILPVLREAFPDAVRKSKTLRLANIGESLLLRHLEDSPQIYNETSLAFLPHHGLLDLRITAHSTDSHEADAQISTIEAIVREKVGDHIYTTGDLSLSTVIGDILVNRSQTLSVAESCTGGLVANMITDVPGSSRWFERGWVTYSNESKQDQLKVPEDLLKEFGAVSEPVARAMAEGARQLAGTTWAIATTGIAGPDGGTPTKPVGTVFAAVASAKHTVIAHLMLSGLRETIKLRTAHTVLFLLFRQLMDTNS